ncbi:MAG: hypothetical protein GY882_13010, partial [Actinomycetia bacterium]|nr:hypothetical protein [Actinomycetes bacterium]
AKTSGRLETTKDELDGAKASLETKVAELGESQRRNGSLEANLQSTEAEHRDLLATATKSVCGTRSERKQARARLKSQVGEGSLEVVAGTDTDEVDDGPSAEVADEAGSESKPSRRKRLREFWVRNAEANRAADVYRRPDEH